MTWMSARVAEVAAWGMWSPVVRRRILMLAGVEARRARVYAGIRFVGRPDELSIGPGSFVNADLLVGANAPVRIGARVAIGPRTTLLPTTHELGGHDRRSGATAAAPIVIEDGCWLGAGVTVLGGVTIGAGTVVAAGAVVTGDCEPDCLYGGVPARLIRRLEE